VGKFQERHLMSIEDLRGYHLQAAFLSTRKLNEQMVEIMRVSEEHKHNDVDEGKVMQSKKLLERMQKRRREQESKLWTLKDEYEALKKKLT
jgi:predicted RNase H-like nuclease (RuvC/YqgF family)